MRKSLGPRTLLYPTPVLVIGTYDKDGKPNAMTAAWGGICCSDPPCVSVSLRKATYSYGNIMEKGAFTVSIPSRSHVAEADFFGLESGKEYNKFEATGLTPIRSTLVNAPYVDEFPMVLECEMLQANEIGLHTQFIGVIKDVKVRDDIEIAEDKGLISKVDPFIYSPDDRSYYSVGKKVAKAFDVGKKFRKRR